MKSGSDVVITDVTPVSPNKRTLIVRGGDIYIDQNIFADPTHPIALIALRENNKGGNIYVSGKVKEIYGYLYAE